MSQTNVKIKSRLSQYMFTGSFPRTGHSQCRLDTSSVNAASGYDVLSCDPYVRLSSLTERFMFHKAGSHLRSFGTNRSDIQKFVMQAAAFIFSTASTSHMTTTYSIVSAIHPSALTSPLVYHLTKPSLLTCLSQGALRP